LVSSSASNAKPRCGRFRLVRERAVIPLSSATTIESLLEGLQRSAKVCADSRASLGELLASQSSDTTVLRERTLLWLDIISGQDFGSKERREEWLARAKKSGMDGHLIASLYAHLSRQGDRIGGYDRWASLAREDIASAARNAKLDPELERQLGEEIATFAEASATAHQLREDLIAHAADRIEVLSRKMLRRSSIVVRSNVQTGDVFIGAAMRLMRALKQVSPLDPRAFFGLVGLQIRRELVDMARHFRRDTLSYSFDEPEHEHDRQRTDNPRNLECWTRFHDAVGRLPAEQREVVDLHWYQGLPQEEIAGLLKVDKSTVKRRWRAARECLAKELQDCASVMLSGA
jgi:RNA polymerase sigma factor (sigma-70 family)